jgi:hypothetical protein
MKLPTILLLMHVFVGRGMRLPSRCLAGRDRHTRKAPYLMGETYEVRRWDKLSFHNICAKLRENRFKHSEVDKEEYKDRQDGNRINLLQESRNNYVRYTDRWLHRFTGSKGDFIRPLLYFHNKESRQKAELLLHCRISKKIWCKVTDNTTRVHRELRITELGL